MNIGFVGNGAVASAFGCYLSRQGFVVSSGYDRHLEKTARFADLTGAKACRSAQEVADASDLVFITTRDDQIEAVCGTMCRQQAILPRHWVGHMSGAHPSTILAPAARQGASVFSLHPLQAFADTETAVENLPATYFSLEGDDDRLEKVETMMQRLGNVCFRIGPEQKSLYHLAACTMSNYLVALMDAGLQAFEAIGIEPQQGFAAMRPLIQGTLNNIAQLGPAKALTGPIARGDVGTIEQHLQVLQKQNMSALGALYAFLGTTTVSLASRGGFFANTEPQEQLLKLFADALAVQPSKQ